MSRGRRPAPEPWARSSAREHAPSRRVHLPMPQSPASTAQPQEERAGPFRQPSIAAGGLDALVFRGIELVSKVLLVVVTGRLMEPAGRGLYALASLSISLCGLPFGAVWLANAVEIARRRVVVREL